MGKRLESARDFIRSVRNADEPDPVYFVYGDEPYLLDEAVDAIVATAAPGGTDEFNFDKFRGNDASAEQIRESAETLPMTVDRRIVLVRDLQEMPAAELEELEPYFESPAGTTCLILHAYREDAGELDLRSGALRTLNREATTQEFESLYDHDAEAVVRKHARQYGLALSEAARAFLVDAVGTDIGTLDQALEKVDLYVGPAEEGGRREVGVEAVQEVVAETRVRSVFDLTDALGERNFETALTILDRMLLDGEPPLRILHMIARHFRIVGRLHDPDYRTLQPREQAQKLGVPHFFVDDYRSHARTFEPADVATVRTRILEVDRRLKSSGLADRTVLEELLYDICFREAE